MNPAPRSVINRLVDWLVRHRFAILVGSALFSLAAWPVSRQLKFNETVESMFADEDPHLVDFVASKRIFGGDELVGVIYTDPRLFEPDGQARVRELAAGLSKIEGVLAESTQDLATN